MKQLLVSFWMLCAAGVWASEAVLHHTLEVRIDAASRQLHVAATVEGDLPADGLWLRAGRDVAQLSVDGSPVQPFQAPVEGRLPVPRGASRVDLVYRVDVDEDRWPYLFLGPGDGWYPESPGAMVTFDLQLVAPEGWSSLTQGAADPQQRDRWRQLDPQRGIYLLSGPWVARHVERDGMRAAAFLLGDDPQLADRYIDAALDAMQSYSAAIGSYPYHSFTLVENRDQTGWGFPGFTLLGSQVIRLPFIIHTSFPHEVLHNWWGNGVFADRSGGNWTEGLTTYLSDHLSRERSGQGREYRLDTLVNWLDFTGEHRDFPLAEFRGRHDRATQAVGYGRGMFLFHMLRRRLGDRQFLDGLRTLYRDYAFRVADFADIRTVFEEVCDCRLDDFFTQWLQRTGAPQLELEVLERRPDGIDLRLRQSTEPPWVLDVPLQVTGVDGSRTRHTLPLHGAVAEYRIETAVPPARVDVDPDIDLFRRLYPEERPATFSAVFGAPRVSLSVAGLDDSASLQRALLRDRPGWYGGEPSSGGARVWIGLDQPLARERFANAGVEVAVEGGDVVVGGRRFALTDELVVAVAAELEEGPALWLMARRATGLERLLQRLPRYGRFSYAVFEQAAERATVTGRWEVRQHPLTVSLAPVDGEAPEPDPGPPLF